ncbi:Bacterial bifunctional deaminase-reductase, C-terminal [Candidatus Nanopelagicaceae bacterium]|jgi:riboflavin biosynthesis pyrimidine reductase
MGEKVNILTFMTVTVTLVVGSDGSTTKDGSSAGVTTAADRSEFLARRRTADCILIGGNTARTEPYHRTPVPVVVISRSLINPLADNRLAHCWNLSPEKALDRAIKTFGPNVHIEAGVAIITELISAGRIDALELSITSVTGGEDFIDIEKLIGHFSQRSEVTKTDTRFISARK